MWLFDAGSLAMSFASINRKRSGSRFPQNGKTKISQVERKETFHQTVGSLMLVPCGQRTDRDEKKSR
jgi:hypothetical protein